MGSVCWWEGDLPPAIWHGEGGQNSGSQRRRIIQHRSVSAMALSGGRLHSVVRHRSTKFNVFSGQNCLAPIRQRFRQLPPTEAARAAISAVCPPATRPNFTACCPPITACPTTWKTSSSLEIGQFQETIRRGEPPQRISGRQRSERLGSQGGFRRLHVRGCGGRCEVVDIHRWCVHSASENLIAQQIEKVQQRRTRPLAAPLR